MSLNRVSSNSYYDQLLDLCLRSDVDYQLNWTIFLVYRPVSEIAIVTIALMLIAVCNPCYVKGRLYDINGKDCWRISWSKKTDSHLYISRVWVEYTGRKSKIGHFNLLIGTLYLQRCVHCMKVQRHWMKSASDAQSVLRKLLLTTLDTTNTLESTVSYYHIYFTLITGSIDQRWSEMSSFLGT